MTSGGLVEAVFTSFVILPLCDSTGRWSPDPVHRLGFEITDTAKHAVCAEHAGDRVVVFDIARDSAGRMRLVLRRAGAAPGGEDVLALPGECRAFRICALAEILRDG